MAPAYWSRLHPSEYTYRRQDGVTAGVGRLFLTQQIRNEADLEAACIRLAAWNLTYDKYELSTQAGHENIIIPLTVLRHALSTYVGTTPLFEIVCGHRPQTWREWWSQNSKSVPAEHRKQINFYMGLPVTA